MKKITNPRYKGLIATIEAQQPSDAVPGQVTKNINFSLYPKTLEAIQELQDSAGVNTRSQLVRAAIEFAKSNDAEFQKFLAGGVKVG